MRQAIGVLILILAGPPLGAAINPPVKVEGGQVAGTPGKDGSITVFKGIPFAAPPVGDLRWKAPKPAAAWSGMKKADQFGEQLHPEHRHRAQALDL